MDADSPAECRDAPVEHNADGFSADDWNRRLAVLRQTRSYARSSGREARRRHVRDPLADREEDGSNAGEASTKAPAALASPTRRSANPLWLQQEALTSLAKGRSFLAFRRSDCRSRAARQALVVSSAAGSLGQDLAQPLRGAAGSSTVTHSPPAAREVRVSVPS
jgi:hypothetical protein